MPVGYHGPPGPFWIGPTVIAIAIILYVIWFYRKKKLISSSKPN